MISLKKVCVFMALQELRKKAYGVRIVRQFQSPARKYGICHSWPCSWPFRLPFSEIFAQGLKPEPSIRNVWRALSLAT